MGRACGGAVVRWWAGHEIVMNTEGGRDMADDWVQGQGGVRGAFPVRGCVVPCHLFLLDVGDADVSRSG